MEALKQHITTFSKENQSMKALIDGLEAAAADTERIQEENSSLINQCSEMQKLNEQLAQAKSGDDLESVYSEQYKNEQKRNNELHQEI